jgi:hypothetical protein
METSLQDVFSPAEIEEQVQPEPEQETVVEPEAEVSTETEEEVQAAPTAETPSTEVDIEELQKQINAFKAKALDETQKRQELERQLNQQEPPDAFADPEAAIDYQVGQVRAEMQSRFLDLSEANAKTRHEDFDQMKDVFFSQMLTENPVLQQQALMQPDPYGWIYTQAKNHTELSKIGSVTDWQQQKEAEIRAQLEAEYAEKAKQATEEAISRSIPKTLANATAAGGNSKQPWAGPTPLNEVFKK